MRHFTLMPRDKRAFVVGRRFLALLGMTEKVRTALGRGGALPPAGCACHLPQTREARGTVRAGVRRVRHLTCTVWRRLGQAVKGRKPLLYSCELETKLLAGANTKSG